MATELRRKDGFPVPSSARSVRTLGDDTDMARGAADAALLVERIGVELADLSLLVAELEAALSATIAAAAVHDPAVILQAQKLDLVKQSLHGLAMFLSGLQHHRLGREPLDFDGLAATLHLSALGDRLAGRPTGGTAEGLELF